MIASREAHTRIRLEETVELDQRLLVEADDVEILGRDAAFAEAVGDRPRREARIVLLAREALLLSGSNNPAVLDETGSRIVVIRRLPRIRVGIRTACR